MTKIYFVYDGDGGFEWFQSKAAAKKDLLKTISQYRKRAEAESDGEWDLDVERVCMGVVTHEVILNPIGTYIRTEYSEPEDTWDAVVDSCDQTTLEGCDP